MSTPNTECYTAHTELTSPTLQSISLPGTIAAVHLERGHASQDFAIDHLNHIEPSAADLHYIEARMILQNSKNLEELRTLAFRFSEANLSLEDKVFDLEASQVTLAKQLKDSRAELEKVKIDDESILVAKNKKIAQLASLAKKEETRAQQLDSEAKALGREVNESRVRIHELETKFNELNTHYIAEVRRSQFLAGELAELEATARHGERPLVRAKREAEKKEMETLIRGYEGALAAALETVAHLDQERKKMRYISGYPKMQASTAAARKSRPVSQPFMNCPISTLLGHSQRHCCTMGAMATSLFVEGYKGQKVTSWKLVHDLGPLCSPFGIMIEEIRSQAASVESEHGSEVADHSLSDENDVSYDSERENDSISLFSFGSSVITTSTTDTSSSIETKLDLLICDMASLTIRGILSETDGAELEEAQNSVFSLRVDALEALHKEERALIGKVHILESKLASLLQEKRTLERSNWSNAALLVKKETEILNLRYAVSRYMCELEDARQLADERGACLKEILNLGRAARVELLQKIDALHAREKRRRDGEEASRAFITMPPGTLKHSELSETAVEPLPEAYALKAKDGRPDNEMFHVRKQNRRHSR
ncbi:hypothetical protein VNI00_006804 [Paramarasmius palmivorus]|uniref:Uncharacterized protein n=1 Tax=Paramarasmius palmivorus TaxID=297713 RepID=A0AAW0D726_9AGAR